MQKCYNKKQAICLELSFMEVFETNNYVCSNIFLCRRVILSLSWIKSKRAQKYKNIKAKYNNFANKNYNGINNDIYATDVTYIPVPIDVPDNPYFYVSYYSSSEKCSIKNAHEAFKKIHSKGKIYRLICWSRSKTNSRFYKFTSKNL